MRPPVFSSKTSARSRCQAGDWPRLLCPIVKASQLPIEGSSTLKVSWAPLAKSPFCAGIRTRGLTPELPCSMTKTSASVLAPRRSLVHVWTVYQVIGCSELQGTGNGLRGNTQRNASCMGCGSFHMQHAAGRWCIHQQLLPSSRAWTDTVKVLAGGSEGQQPKAVIAHHRPLKAATSCNEALPCSIRARKAAQLNELYASQLCLDHGNTSSA